MPYSHYDNKNKRTEQFALGLGEKFILEPPNPDEFIIDTVVEDRINKPDHQTYVQFESYRVWPHCPFPGPVVWRAATWSVEDGFEHMPWWGNYCATREEAEQSLNQKY